MHQNHLGPLPFQHRLDALQYPGSHIKEGLPVLHNVQVIFRLHPESLQHHIQHLPVLPRDADHRLEVRPGMKLLHQGTHLNGLRPGAENQHHLFQGHIPPSKILWVYSTHFLEYSQPESAFAGKAQGKYPFFVSPPGFL